MTAPPRFNAGPETRGITITVNERVYAGLVDMARAASRTPNVQAQLLFEAAYSARCRPTGDRDLDAAVAAMDEPGSGAERASLPAPALRPVTAREVTKPILTARQAAHAAIVARAKAAVSSRLDASSPARHAAPLAAIAHDAKPVAETMGGGMAEIPSPAVTKAENTHVDDAFVAPHPTGEDVASQDAPDAMGVAEGPAVEPVPAAAEPAGAPVEAPSEPVGVAAPAVVGAGAPAETAPAPAAAPSEPLISAATLKYMRTLKSIGNSMDEIADMVGLPVKAVREALAGKPR